MIKIIVDNIRCFKHWMFYFVKKGGTDIQKWTIEY